MTVQRATLELIPHFFEVEINTGSENYIKQTGRTFCTSLYSELVDYRVMSSDLEKYAYAEIGFAGLAVWGALETLARAIHVLSLKSFSFFVADQEQFEEEYLMPAKINTITSWIVTHCSALALKENLQSDTHVIDNLHTRVTLSYLRLYVLRPPQ